jgi:hypothetical protein
MMSIQRGLGSAALALLVAVPASADIIDFESQAPGAALGTVMTATNEVTFSVVGGASAYVHVYGAPQTGFAPGDTVAAATGFTTGGDQFLADEPLAENGLVNNLPYRLSFLNPIIALSLDLLDFRNDGGSVIGDSIVLTAWANDNFTSSVWSTSITITGGMPDASWHHVSTLAGIGEFRSFTIDVSGGGDVGTGIDNIEFSTVPEPGTLLLLGSGIAGLRTLRRRRESRS